jgi:hypothetical protein
MQMRTHRLSWCLVLSIAALALAGAQSEPSSAQAVRMQFEQETNCYLRADLLVKSQSVLIAAEGPESVAAVDAIITEALKDENSVVQIEGIRLAGLCKKEQFIPTLDAIYFDAEKGYRYPKRVATRCMIIRTLRQMPTAPAQQVYGKIISRNSAEEITQDIMETIAAIKETGNTAFIPTLKTYNDKVKAHCNDLNALLTGEKIAPEKRDRMKKIAEGYSRFTAEIDTLVGALVKEGR